MAAPPPVGDPFAMPQPGALPDPFGAGPAPADPFGAPPLGGADPFGAPAPAGLGPPNADPFGGLGGQMPPMGIGGAEQMPIPQGPGQGGQPEFRAASRACFGGSAGKLHSHSASIGFILTAVAVALLTVASFGTPFVDKLEFVKAVRPGTRQVMKVGLFGDCLVDYEIQIVQCNRPGFGFSLQGFSLPEADVIKGLLAKGKTFWFFFPPATALLGFAAICADQTHLALFYFLLMTTIFSAAGSLTMLLIFTPLIKKINSQTELQAKAGLGLVFTVISSIMLLVATFLTWESSAFQSCRPSYADNFADDGRNEKREADDPYKDTREQWLHDRDRKESPKGPPAYDTGAAPPRLEFGDYDMPPAGQPPGDMGFNPEGASDQLGQGFEAGPPLGSEGMPGEPAPNAGDAMPGAGLGMPGEELGTQEATAVPAADPFNGAQGANQHQDSTAIHSEEMERQRHLLEQMHGAPKQKAKKKNNTAGDATSYALTWYTALNPDAEDRRQSLQPANGVDQGSMETRPPINLQSSDLAPQLPQQDSFANPPQTTGFDGPPLMSQMQPQAVFDNASAAEMGNYSQQARARPRPKQVQPQHHGWLDKLINGSPSSQRPGPRPMQRR